MSAADYGLIGGIVGAIVGILGGIVGTYFAIRNTQGPKERAFTIRASIICWVMIVLVGIAAYLIPFPYKVFTSVPVWIGLPILILYWNKKQAELRESDERERASD